MSKKDPAVLFYITNWLVSTKEMKADCRGWYLNLILHQYDKGDLPNDLVELANLADVRVDEYERFKQVFEQVLKHKFKQKENGRLSNDMAASVITKRETFKEERSNAGKISYFLKYCRKNLCQDENVLQLVKNSINFNDLDVKNEQMLKQVFEQVFEQTSELYINRNKNINNSSLLGNSNNEGIKEEVVKVIITLEDRKKNFGKSLEEFKETYPREMLNDFYNYWRETKPNGTKMKFEFEKTWDLNLRLQRWHRNVKENNPNNEGLKIDWDSEKNKFLNDMAWQMRISQEKGIKKEVLDAYIKQFIEDVEIKDDYKAVNGLKKHFINSLPKFISKIEIQGVSASKNNTSSHIPVYEGDALQKLMDKFS